MNAKVVGWGSGVLLGIGALLAVVFFLQPWRSCSYEDTAAGCAMLPGDAAVMTAGLLMAIIGAGGLTVGFVSRYRRYGR